MEDDSDSVSTITRILQGAGQGSAAIDEVLPKVYAELRRIATQALRRERPEHTLSATELVHEAYLRLSRSPTKPFQNRQQFFAAAAVSMRRILVEHARRRQAGKRIPPSELVALDEAPAPAQAIDLDLLALDEALTVLGELDERMARTVELRYFAGLSEAETAEVLGISQPTVRRAWRAAKVWLKRRMEA